MSTLSVLIFACIFFHEFHEFCRFHEIKSTQNFLLNSICENRYTLSMQKKIMFLESKHKKNMHKKRRLI